MTDKQKIQVLAECFNDVIWMAIRYAHGRQTYAPHTVRDAITNFQIIFPEWKPKKDYTIKPKCCEDSGFIEDYLDDLFES